ncbi:myomegalin-like isoform X4 [Genypterus blacodes]|uniref:myomegalin-like isoform X4 n=1 Tax=Genypterus blacodes TaxID=154954 RepID=UPI003F75E5F9
MLDVMKMKDVCRICSRELCGNQRRWIFHPSSKLNLQVLLSHALGHGLTRDGRGEFACSKCTFMLDRMYRFDTVIARVEALSLERLQKLLLEKDRLRQCIGGLFRKHNGEDGDVPLTGCSLGAGTDSGAEDSVSDLSALQNVRYSDMIQDDLVYSVYESWADNEEPTPDQNHHTPQCPGQDPLCVQKPRRCRGCTTLRVTDSDYEAVCKVPRRLGRRSTSCGPSTRYSTADPTKDSAGCDVTFESPSAGPGSVRSPSPASSVESLDAAVDLSSPVNHKESEEPEQGAAEKDPDDDPGKAEPVWEKPPDESSGPNRPVRNLRGSKIPILLRDKLEQSLSLGLPVPLRTSWDPDRHLVLVPELVTPCSQQELQAELEELEEQWMDDYVQCGAFRVQQEEQKALLGLHETSTGLQKHQHQEHIRESQENQKLQLELCSTREEAQRQELNIQNLKDIITSKDREVSELCGLMEEQKKTVSSLTALINRQQLKDPASAVLTAQEASLFQAQLELQASQRTQRRAAGMRDDLSRALRRLEEDLQGSLEHRRETERHNQELRASLETSRCALQEREDQLRDEQRQRQREQEDTEATIRQLETSLHMKEQQIEDLKVLQQVDPKEKRDTLVQKLRDRVRQRDRELERAVDEKFSCVEEKEAESRRLQILLRERDRDVETQRRVLSNNEETISSLELLLRSGSLQVDQVCESYVKVQQQQQQNLLTQSDVLRERDAIINQLQGALQACTLEAQDLRRSLLGQIQTGPAEVLEEMKVHLQLKDQILQDVLDHRTLQAREHQDHIQDLLSTIGARDQYIQDSSLRLGEVMSEQTARLQELRKQLSSGLRSWSSLEVQALQEELNLLLRKDKESQELSRSQAGRLDFLSSSLRVKDQILTDLHRQLSDPPDLPLVVRLTQEVQDLKESLVRLQGGPALSGPAEFGDLSSGHAEDPSSDDEEWANTKAPGGLEPLLGGQGLLEVRELLDQKRAVERELSELKAQLEKAGFSSLSQIRKALFSLRAENEDLKHQLSSREESDDLKMHQEEEELDVTIAEEEEEEEGEEEEGGRGQWEAWDGERCLTAIQTRDQEKRKPSRPTSLDLHSRLSQEHRLQGVPSANQEHRLQGAPSANQEHRLQGAPSANQEPRIASPAMCKKVQHLVSQLKEHRQLLKTPGQQDSKQIQDLQDLGYETCGRSENEAEREETSSPEFDDLEMCTSLDCGSLWPGQDVGGGDSVSSLQRLVEDLRSQLSRSQGVVRGLRSRLRSFSTSGDRPSTPRKVNWSFQASPSQSGAVDDGGRRSADGRPTPHEDLRELVSRVDALEDQLREGGKTSVSENSKNGSWPSKFDALIQAQARELSHLRQRLREGQGVSLILTQHLGETTKAFEELLRANDIDYYMGQSFREQLAQSSSLAQRVNAKISTRDQSEDPEEKTELLAIRLSKELQQKDQLIESLRAKLNHHHHHHHHQRSDTPCSSHTLSDQSEGSFVSASQEDVDVCSEDELLQEDTGRTDSPSHSSIISSSSHAATSCLTCPIMQCSNSPPKAIDSHTAPVSDLTCDPVRLRPRCHGSVSLADAQQELQTLQRQLAHSLSSPQSRPPQCVPVLSQHRLSFEPLSHSTYQPSLIGGALDCCSAIKARAGLLDSSALWDTAYGSRPMSLGAVVSSGASSGRSGSGHTGSELMKEHLSEIRVLRQRLEDSIQTNERLRQQLEDRLTHTLKHKGAPTNIYIQGVDSVSELSSELRALKDQNIGLRQQLQQLTADVRKEAEQRREAEAEAERWAGHSRELQADAQAQKEEITHMTQDRLRNHETITRLQHELSVLQQQVCERHRNTHSGQVESMMTSDPRESSRQAGVRPRARRKLLTAGPQQGRAPDVSSYDPLGRHTAGHVEDFQAVQQQILEGGHLLLTIETTLHSLSGPERQDSSLQQGSVRKLLADTHTLCQIVEEVQSLLRRFWTVPLPNADETKEKQEEEELVSLRLQLSEKERALMDAKEKLKSSNVTKDSMERLIISQLLRTRDVLKKAKTNLQVKGQGSSVNSPSLLVGVW